MRLKSKFIRKYHVLISLIAKSRCKSKFMEKDKSIPVNQFWDATSI